MTIKMVAFTFLGIFLSLSVFFFNGCGTSESSVQEGSPPPQPSATEMIQKEMNDLRSENDQLKKMLAQAEQDRRTITAHAAELETQIAEMKEKPSALVPPPTPSVMESPRERYKDAITLFRNRNYQEASLLFQALLESELPVEMKDNCQYWLGECAYGAKRYGEAIGMFQKVFTYKWSEKKDDSQIMIANSYLAAGNKVKAREEFELLIKKFPASPFVRRAKEKLGSL